jgi:choline dehydrogenase-like flavoprotein
MYDLIVIGSGPGGAVAALRETEMGKKVLVLEAGKSYAPGSIEHHSLTQTANQFGRGGLSFIWGLKPVLYAEGRTLGGGSEVNSGLYHRIEGRHRTSILGTVGVSEADWRILEELVENEIAVQKAPEEHIPDYGLVKGAIHNGLIAKEIPRWRSYFPKEEHQSMQVTYLSRARELGAEFLTNAEVFRISPEHDRINVFLFCDGIKTMLTSTEVVIAAGTVETPRILNRSKLSSRNFELNFHPMLRAVAMQSGPVNDGDLFPSWQAWTSDRVYKYGYSVSTFPYLSATLPSLGELRQFSDQELSRMAAYFSSFAINDSKAKLIRIGKSLFPIVVWGKLDKQAMVSSSQQLQQLLLDGDAIEVWPTQGISPITTVHLFGSIPIGRSSLIDEAGRLKSDSRIRISDGSLMPHAPWGNPQGAIMVLCELMAKRVREK